MPITQTPLQLPTDGAPVALLLGGGIESTFLLHELLAGRSDVHPVHISCGLIWDTAERSFIERFLVEHASPRLRPLIRIHVPLAGFLGNHWAVTGINVPQSTDDSSRLEIPLRNLTLLGLALHTVKHVPGIQLMTGTTADNHYPDGSRPYFDLCEPILSLEAGQPIRILTPVIGITKTEVIRRSPGPVLAGSFSCVSPVADGHCGRCIKCGRRQASFAAANVADPTRYAASPQFFSGVP